MEELDVLLNDGVNGGIEDGVLVELLAVYLLVFEEEKVKVELEKYYKLVTMKLSHSQFDNYNYYWLIKADQPRPRAN